MSPEDFQRQLRDVIARRDSEEARALQLLLLARVDRRVMGVLRRRTRGVVSDAEREELVSEVMMQLLRGSLAAFRGNTPAELFAFVRVITDRAVYRAAQRKIRERTLLDTHASDIRDWSRSAEAVGERTRLVGDPPLADADASYLTQLLEAGSRAELARAQGVSRAAVTQRIKRIEARIASLAEPQQEAVEAWLLHTAREVLGR